MGKDSEIVWCTDTVNFWISCTKVSPGCKYCYAEKLATTRMQRQWGPGAPRIMTKGAVKLAEKLNRMGGRVIFSMSLADWLDAEAPIENLATMLHTIWRCTNATWLLLSKRPQLFLERLEAAQDYHFDYGDRNLAGWISDWRHGLAPAHIRVGTSVEDQPRADERIPELLKIPAAGRFLSVEPLLGPVQFDDEWLRCEVGSRHGIHRVIVGGESGKDARPCNVEWVRSIVRQCRAADVKCLVKQLGSNVLSTDGDEFPDRPRFRRRHPEPWSVVLKHPKGADPSEWPDDLRNEAGPDVANISRWWSVSTDQRGSGLEAGPDKTKPTDSHSATGNLL